MSDYEEGCYGDGSLGCDHCTSIIFDLAQDEGYEGSPGDREIIDQFNRGIDIDQETLFEIEEGCIDHLNEYCSDDHHYWGYENGDFGYWRINDEE